MTEKMSFKAVKITDKVWWVGAIDWNLKEFHGYHTHRGTTYNAYLVLGEKPTLIDTVKAPFKEEMYSRIASVMDPSKIEIIVSNHAEPDHSGALADAIADLQPEKVYASVAGVRILDAQFHIGEKLTAVKTGDSIDLGGLSLSFVETKMLHWPDSMFSYLKEEKILFTQDGFGMHLATDRLFIDENPWDMVEEEMEKYYANILLLYSPQVLKLLEVFPSLNLDVQYIATDHGPVWRGADVAKPLELYRKFAEQKPAPRAVVVYDTMWGATDKMGRSIADGIRSTGAGVTVCCMHSRFRSDVATAVMGAGALVVGSPTINNMLFPSVADVLCYLKGLRPKNLIGATFGSFGWSGEAAVQAAEILKSMNAEMPEEPLKLKFASSEEDFQKCFDFGVRIGKLLLERAKQ